MDYKIRISPIARSNVKQAVAYYKKKASLRVARNFIKDYEQTLEKIKKNPFFQIYYEDFRGLPLKRYPYVFFIKSTIPSKLFM